VIVDVVVVIDGVVVVIRVAVDKIIPESRLTQARSATKRGNRELGRCVEPV